MAWDRLVPGTFGDSDLIFAGHPADEDRAFEWLIDLRKREIGWRDARRQLEEYLTSRKASPQHIADQLKRIEPAMKPWLLD